MYQALYRKWRPQTFDEVIGQKHITETLRNQVKTGRLSHAYIFIGTRGTGKTTCARILAKAVNCESPVNGNPCGHCASCRSIAEGSAVDIVELDAASNNGVDNVRALREEAMFSPAELKKRVYIIDEVHMLSSSAFNALLKILEEPPQHLMFILATTELHKVPATILSRCQRHSFKRIDTAALTEHIEYIGKQEKLELEHDAAELIARLAEGGARDAMSLLDQCSGESHIDVDAVYSVMGLAGNRRISQLFSFIIARNVEEVLKGFSSMWMDGKDPASLLAELSTLMRDILMVKVAPRGAKGLISGTYDGTTLKGFASKLTNEELLCMLEKLQSRLSEMRSVKNPRTAAELCLISLCENSAGDTALELRARISRLEEQVKNGVVQVRAAEAPEYEAPQAEEASERNTAYADIPEAPAYEEIRTDEPVYTEAPEPLESLQEEQPEDSFLDKSSVIPVKKAAEAQYAVTWKELLAKTRSKLSPLLLSWIDNETKIYGREEGGVFNIYAEPSFCLARINNPKNSQLFSEAASEIAGRQMNVRFLPMPENTAQTKSIEDLKKYPEVKFIN